MPKKIALDFDETYTAAPELWDAFVNEALSRKHRVVFCTYRHAEWRNGDIEEAAAKLGIPIVYTNGSQKATECYADIWIDDAPETIPTKGTLRHYVERAKDE